MVGRSFAVILTAVLVLFSERPRAVFGEIESSVCQYLSILAIQRRRDTGGPIVVLMGVVIIVGIVDPVD